jgi:hypothetical protein
MVRGLGVLLIGIEKTGASYQETCQCLTEDYQGEEDVSHPMFATAGMPLV